MYSHGETVPRAIEVARDPSEMQVESEVSVWLQQAGHRVWRQVECEIGTADIVTDVAVIEVKRVLTRQAMFSAIGQVLMYRQAIDSARGAIVVGRPPRKGFDLDMVRHARRLGVDIWFWKNGRAVRPKLAD